MSKYEEYQNKYLQEIKLARIPKGAKVCIEAVEKKPNFVKIEVNQQGDNIPLLKMMILAYKTNIKFRELVQATIQGAKMIYKD